MKALPDIATSSKRFFLLSSMYFDTQGKVIDMYIHGEREREIGRERERALFPSCLYVCMIHVCVRVCRERETERETERERETDRERDTLGFRCVVSEYMSRMLPNMLQYRPLLTQV